MEIYNESKKFIHSDINNLLSEDITCIFNLVIISDIEENYKLIDKGERGELFIMLNKNNKLLFYYGNKIKRQLESTILEKNKSYHIIFTRSVNSEKNCLYINGKLDTVTPVYNIEGLEKTDTEIKFYSGGVDYKMGKIKIYNYAMTPKNIKMQYYYDTRDKGNMLRLISNRLDELMEVGTGIFCGYMIEDMLILFTKCQMFLSQKNYPLDTYIKYNMEQHEFNIPQILNLLTLKINDLNEKFNTDDMANFLITWQVGMFETTYPKNISGNSITGYWIEKEVSPFIPFTGKGLTYVSSEGNLTESQGTFQNGMSVSFIKLIINSFLKTKKSDLLSSILKLIDYMIAISNSHEYSNGGIPLYYPKLDDEEWKYNISIKNGNLINYLRTIEIILNSSELLQCIDPKIEQLKNAYLKTLNLLLKLQVNIGKKKTIWSQYYNKNNLSPTKGNDNEPMGLCSLESAQILLYLMDFDNPTKNIKNAIIGGCEWFKEHKIYGWTQIFDKKSYNPEDPENLTEQQTLLTKYKYSPFPEKMTMHSRYYDFEKEKPLFQENNKLYTLETFNDMSIDHRNNEFHIGLWGHHLLEMYEEWKKIHDDDK
jgi:PelA/Pel-15E family pectate lyase